jgi:hypothetical protein
MCSLPVYSHRCCGQPVPPGVSLLRSASAPRSIPRWRGMSPPLHSPWSSQGGVCACIPVPCQRSQECPKVAQHVSALHSPQEFPRWRVHVHSCSVPALPGVSQGSAACLRTAQPPGVPKVACACAFKSSCSVPALPRVSHGGAACLRTQEYPKVAQHVSALHSTRGFPRWRVHVLSWLCCHFSL